jgi:hypothetical protein
MASNHRRLLRGACFWFWVGMLGLYTVAAAAVVVIEVGVDLPGSDAAAINQVADAAQGEGGEREALQ